MEKREKKATTGGATRSAFATSMRIPVVADNDDLVPQRRALFRHLNFQKWSENSVCFIDFDFEMCFAPQLHALFEPLNFQK